MITLVLTLFTLSIASSDEIGDLIACPDNCPDACDTNGTFCTVCLNGEFWGESCQFNCSSNCAIGMCEQEDGKCTHGCTSVHVWGANCDQECPARCYQNGSDVGTGGCYRNGDCFQCQGSRLWGKRCLKECPENCTDNQCWKSTGECHHGCKGGRWNETGYGYHWGFTCMNMCPEHCKERRCHVSTGFCHACEPPWYGEGCDHRCPRNCRANSTAYDGCEQDSGSCLACRDGYYGAYCDRSVRFGSLCNASFHRLLDRVQYGVEEGSTCGLIGWGGATHCIKSLYFMPYYGAIGCLGTGAFMYASCKKEPGGDDAINKARTDVSHICALDWLHFDEHLSHPVLKRMFRNRRSIESPMVKKPKGRPERPVMNFSEIDSIIPIEVDITLTEVTTPIILTDGLEYTADFSILFSYSDGKSQKYLRSTGTMAESKAAQWMRLVSSDSEIVIVTSHDCDHENLTVFNNDTCTLVEGVKCHSFLRMVEFAISSIITELGIAAYDLDMDESTIRASRILGGDTVTFMASREFRELPGLFEHVEFTLTDNQTEISFGMHFRNIYSNYRDMPILTAERFANCSSP